MEYHQVIILKNGIECCLRNGVEGDGQAVSDHFHLTHGQADYFLSYPDENCYDVIQESQFLKEKSENKNEVVLVAVVDNAIIRNAGMKAAGKNTRR